MLGEVLGYLERRIEAMLVSAAPAGNGHAVTNGQDGNGDATDARIQADARK